MPKTKEQSVSTDCNVVIVIGEVTSPPSSRELQNGAIVSTFDVATQSVNGRLSVPVSYEGDLVAIEEGQRVLVSGAIRRRFFRSGSTVTSRTELLAESVIPVRRRTQVERALNEAIANLKETAKS